MKYIYSYIPISHLFGGKDATQQMPADAFIVHNNKQYLSSMQQAQQTVQTPQPGGGQGVGGGGQPATSGDINDIFPLVLQLSTAEQRENALTELSKRREVCPDMAPILWYSFGTMSVLLQEIIMVYPMLSPQSPQVLSSNASTRVCNALALLQLLASHPETKTKFMSGMHFMCHKDTFIRLCSNSFPNFSSPSYSTYSFVSIPIFEYCVKAQSF